MTLLSRAEPAMGYRSRPAGRKDGARCTATRGEHMKPAILDRVREVAAPMLEDGEEIRTVTIAMVGVPSLARSARLGLIVTILTLGMFTMASSPKKRFIVLTNRRMFAMAGNQRTGRPTGEVIFQERRSAL